MGRRSTVALCIFGLAALAVILGSVPDEAEGQIPTIDISIIPEHRDQTATIGPTTNQVLEFEGEVTLSKPTPYIIPVEVDLELEMPGTLPPWNYTFDPEFLTYTASGTQNFTCLVTVPPALLVTDFFTLIFNASTNAPAPPFTTGPLRHSQSKRLNALPGDRGPTNAPRTAGPARSALRRSVSNHSSSQSARLIEMIRKTSTMSVLPRRLKPRPFLMIGQTVSHYPTLEKLGSAST